MSAGQELRADGRDRLRIAWAVLRLEWWLEWFGAPSRVYRPMRQELAANLSETAVEPGGVAAGVQRVGSLEELAREAAAGRDRFRWERGLTVALLVFSFTLTWFLVASAAAVVAFVVVSRPWRYRGGR